MATVFTGPTTTAHTRTLMASYAAWKELIPRLDSALARRIEQQVSRNRNQPLIRVELSLTEATTVLSLANKN